MLDGPVEGLGHAVGQPIPELGAREGHPHADLIGVGGNDAGRLAGPQLVLDHVRVGHVLEVCIDHPAAGPLLTEGDGADLPGHPRTHPAGAHDEAGTDRARSARVVDVDPDNPAPTIAHQSGDGGAMTNRGTGLDRGIDEAPVEHRPTGRVEPVDIAPCGQIEGHRVVPVIEHHAAGTGGARRSDGVEHAPPAEQQDTGRGDAVRRQGVAAIGGPVDGRHPHTGSGQLHGGGRAGGPGTDDHHVVVVVQVRRGGVGDGHVGDGHRGLQRGRVRRGHGSIVADGGQQDLENG